MSAFIIPAILLYLLSMFLSFVLMIAYENTIEAWHRRSYFNYLFIGALIWPLFLPIFFIRHFFRYVYEKIRGE